jgi:hypothetical protein
MIGQDFCLGRTGMQPLDPGPRNTRGQEYHGQCHGSAAQPRDHAMKDRAQGAGAGDRSSHQTRPARLIATTTIAASTCAEVRNASAPEGSRSRHERYCCHACAALTILTPARAPASRTTAYRAMRRIWNGGFMAGYSAVARAAWVAARVGLAVPRRANQTRLPSNTSSIAPYTNGARASFLTSQK